MSALTQKKERVMDKEETTRDVLPWTFVPLKAYESPAQPVPEITDWKSGAQAFNDQLRGMKPESHQAGFPLAVVGLFGHAKQLLYAWAKERGAQVLEPPPASSLLDGTAGLWPELRHPG